MHHAEICRNFQLLSTYSSVFLAACLCFDWFLKSCLVRLGIVLFILWRAIRKINVVGSLAINLHQEVTCTEMISQICSRRSFMPWTKNKAQEPSWMRRAGVKPICSKCLVSPLDSVVIQHPSIQSPQYRPQTLNFRLPRPITAHRFVLKTQNAEVWRISCEWKLVCVHGLFVKIIMSEEFRFFISIKTAHSAGPRFLSKHGNMKPSTGVSARDWSIDLWMWNGRPEALKFLLFVSDKLNIDSDT